MTGPAVTWTAEGSLSWPRSERVSDRYGSITLFADIDDSAFSDMDMTPAVELDELPVGRRCRCTVEVLEARQSRHIGDMFRGLYPPDGGTPAGTVFDLGVGEVFIECDQDGVESFGLLPDDDRDSDWFDPTILYQLHEQQVRVTLVEETP